LPVVRFSRDRRGYEHTYLVDVSPRGGNSSSRLLYWFRTPPGVKVGREAFDADVRRTLEEQYPDVTFDWKTIMATTMPAPAIDWRSRRRAERATKVARRVAPLEDDSDIEDVTVDAAPDYGATVETDRLQPGDAERGEGIIPARAETVADVQLPAVAEGERRPGSGRRRRRRGGRHHRRLMAGGVAGGGPAIVEKSPEGAAADGSPERSGEAGGASERDEARERVGNEQQDTGKVRDGGPPGVAADLPPDGER
jgi:hypothetical protein